jgi:UDP-N-acetylmuramoyl-tripeptide--D-alanyl-D-alanine ligase
MNVFAPNNLRRLLDGAWLREPSMNAPPCSGVGIDTRGDLAGRAFIAIVGEHHDGHDYLAQAQQAGARLAIVQRAVDVNELPDDFAVLRVGNTRCALGRLAAAHRKTLDGTTVISITGSAGKTTTKQMIAGVLMRHLRGSAAPKSFNNDIGVPMSILAAQPGDDFLVLEIGTSRPGEIGPLSQIAAPNIAVLTMVGRAHLEGFGSVEAIRAEKHSMFAHLQTGGLAVLPESEPLPSALRGDRVSIMRFGDTNAADVRRTDYQPTENGATIDVNDSERYDLPCRGAHNARNALAAIVVAQRCGLNPDQIREAFSHIQLPAMRMETVQVGGITIINDAYNANPDSTRASIATFAQQPCKARIVVLGDMLELGAQSEALHCEVLEHLRASAQQPPLARTILLGEAYAKAASSLESDAALGEITIFPEADDAACASIASMLNAGDTALLKASRGMKLERIVDAARALHAVRDDETDPTSRPSLVKA